MILSTLHPVINSLFQHFNFCRQIDDALSQFEAADFQDYSEDFYDLPREFNILGSCLFHKGYLLASHLPRDDMVDVLLWCSYHQVSHYHLLCHHHHHFHRYCHPHCHNCHNPYHYHCHHHCRHHQCHLHFSPIGLFSSQTKCFHATPINSDYIPTVIITVITILLPISL